MPHNTAFSTKSKILDEFLAILSTHFMKIALRKKCPYLNFSGPHFPAFGPNMDRYGISPYSVRIRENTDQKTPNKDTFYAALVS